MSRIVVLALFFVMTTFICQSQVDQTSRSDFNYNIELTTSLNAALFASVSQELKFGRVGVSTAANWRNGGTMGLTVGPRYYWREAKHSFFIGLYGHRYRYSEYYGAQIENYHRFDQSDRHGMIAHSVKTISLTCGAKWRISKRGSFLLELGPNYHYRDVYHSDNLVEIMHKRPHDVRNAWAFMVNTGFAINIAGLDQ